MSKLQPQYLFALVLIGCIGVAALIFNFAIRPGQEKLTNLRTELSQKEATEAEYRANAAAIPALEANVKKMEVERADFLSALPTTAQFGQVAAQIRTLVSAAGGELKSLSFRAGETDNAIPGVRPMGMDLSVGGEFAQIFSVLKSVETQNRFTTVKSIDMQLPTATSFNPKLESTLNLVVYTFDPNQAQMPTTPAATPGATTPDAAGTPPAGAAPAAPAGGTQ